MLQPRKRKKKRGGEGKGKQDADCVRVCVCGCDELFVRAGESVWYRCRHHHQGVVAAIPNKAQGVGVWCVRFEGLKAMQEDLTN